MPDDIHIILKKYAQGELSGDELATFEAMLSKDAGLREELSFALSLVRATEKLERQRLLKVLEKADGKEDTGNTRSPTIWAQAWLKWVALVLLLLTATLAWWWSSRQADTGFVDVAYVRTSAPGAQTKGGAEGILPIAFREYELSKHEKSIGILDGIPESDSLYLYALLLGGHNNYLLGNYSEAVAIFDKILSLSENTSIYQVPNWEDASWTRILALWQWNEKEQDIEKGKQLEKELSAFLEKANPDDVYFKKATELQALLNGD